MTETNPTTPPQSQRIRRGFRLLALTIGLATLFFWSLKGGHTGWTQNQVPIKQTDEITGIEYITYEQRFVPGIDLLGAGLGLAAGVLAVSFLVQRKTKTTNS